jgi:aspartate-semialdehyde dehydrogenase
VQVNADAVKGWKAGSGKGGIIANPNCSTIIMLVPVTPLHKVGKVGEPPSVSMTG